MEPERVYCSKCNKNWAPGSAVEQEDWVCPDCQEKRFGIDLLDFIQKKVQETTMVEDDELRFVFRELAQNADDAKATLLVARITKDALEVANNGRAMKSGHDGHFERMWSVLAGRQRDDPDTTGNFGSGFATVYSFTNHPEVHSNNHSYRMDPTRSDENDRVITLKGKEIHASPYQPHGVLFRFPWRTKKEATRNYEGRGTCFSNESIWRRWGKAEMQALFEDLSSYGHDLLLCAQYLKSIRIVWDYDGNGEAFQVSRDFTCGPDQARTYEGRFQGTVLQGNGDGIWSEDWAWKTAPKEFKYTIAHDVARDDEGRELIACRNELDDLVLVTPTTKTDELRQVKQSDVWLLLPQFPAEEHDLRPRVVYSAIPLTARSLNHFAVTAHLFPEEGRKDLSISGNRGKDREWMDAALRSLVRLYRQVFPGFLRDVRDGNLEPHVAQQVVLDALPVPHAYGWVKPDLIDQTRGNADLVSQHLYGEILKTRCIWNANDWQDPRECIWANNEAQRQLLTLLGVPQFPIEFQEHPFFHQAVANLLNPKTAAGTDAAPDNKASHLNRRLTAGKFITIWKDALENDAIPSEHRLEASNLAIKVLYGQDLRADRQVRDELPVFLNAQGQFCTRGDLRTAPSQCLEVAKAISMRRLPHPDLDKVNADYVDHEPSIDDILEGIHENKEDFAKKPKQLGPLYKHLQELLNQGQQPSPDARASFDVALSESGDLFALDSIYVLPGSSGKFLRKLFDDAKISVSWFDAQLAEQHGATLQRLGAQIAPFAELIAGSSGRSVVDFDDKQLHALVDGLALMPADEIQELAFLPSGGRAVTPNRALLGSTRYEALDHLLGVVDQTFQTALDGHATLVETIRKAGAKEVSANHFAPALEQLAEATEGPITLTDAQWKGISYGLIYLQEQNLRPLLRMPVRWRGDIILSEPQKTTDTRYDSRTWSRENVWRATPESCLKAHPAIESNTRILELHPEVARPGVGEFFNVPIASPVNFARHFLSDYNGEISLFRKHNLHAFAPGLTDETALLKALQKQLLEYFRDDKTESGLQPKDMAVVPCLHDEHGDWAPPEEFVCDLEFDTSFAGARQLHPSLRETPKASLQALGVHLEIPATTLGRTALKAAKNGNRETAQKCLAYAILRKTMEVPKLDKWVATNNKFVRPKDAIAPLPSLIESVGSDHDELALLTSDEPLVKQAAEFVRLHAEAAKERFAELGFRTYAGLKDLVETAIILEQDGAAPPPSLMNDLEQASQYDPPVVGSIKAPYYARKRWWSAEEIFLASLDYLPPSIKETVLEQPDSPHSTYLSGIGARNAPSVHELFHWAQSCEQDHAALWDQIASHTYQLDPEITREFSNEAFVTPSGKELVPRQVVLYDAEIECKSNSRHFVPRKSLAENVQKVLLALGALDTNELEDQELLEVLSEAPTNPDDAIVSKALTREVVCRSLPADQVRVVCKFKGETKTFPALDALIGNHVSTERIQEHRPVIDPRFIEPWSEFVKWARKQGLQYATDAAPITPSEWNWADLTVDEDLSASFAELRDEIESAIHANTGRQLPAEALSWLSNLQVYRRASAKIQYTINNKQVTEHVPCYIESEIKPPRMVLSARGKGDAIHRAAEAVFRVCATHGLTDAIESYSEREHIIRIISDWMQGQGGHGPNGFEEPTPLIETIDMEMETYHQLRSDFEQWYPGCQACRRSTLSDQHGETSEKMRSIVGSRGGRYKGRRNETIGNYLWLCPTCFTLYDRALVKLAWFESNVTPDMLDAALTHYKALAKENPGNLIEAVDAITVPMYGFDATGARVKRTQDAPMFHPDHILKVIANAEQYLKDKQGGQVA